MIKNNGFNPILILLLFGIYFIISYFETKNIPELVYGAVLVCYHVKFKILQKNSL